MGRFANFTYSIWNNNIERDGFYVCCAIPAVGCLSETHILVEAHPLISICYYRILAGHGFDIFPSNAKIKYTRARTQYSICIDGYARPACFTSFVPYKPPSTTFSIYFIPIFSFFFLLFFCCCKNVNIALFWRKFRAKNYFHICVPRRICHLVVWRLICLKVLNIYL